MTLALDGVGVHYGGRTALAAASLTVGTGEWVAVIGANGAGKSSLLRAVAGLVPHTGRVVLGGEDTHALPRRRRAQLVAMVPQTPELPAVMTVRDYVLLGRTPYLGPFGAECADDRRVAAEVTDRIGLAPLADRPLASLSGGERQRAVLARALTQQAPVLLLDEATSALDLGRRIDTLELVDELRRERGLAVLSALHDLTLAAQFADRLVLLAEGHVLADGPADDVLTGPLLSRAFGVRVTVSRDADGQLLVVPRRR